MMIFMMVFTSGCWDSLDINGKNIATTIIIDLKDGDMITYVEIANTNMSNSNEQSGSSGYKFTVVKCHGKTITEMRDNLEEILNKPIYLSGVRALIFTENFAKENLVEYLYRFRADESYRKKINTFITREDPEELFKIAKEKKFSIGFLTEEIVGTLNNLGKSFSRTTMRLLENVSRKYSGMLLACMGVSNNEIALVGYSVISGGKVTSFLPVEESRGMIFLKSDKPKFFYRIPYKDLNLTVKVELKKRNIKPLYENEKISFDITMEFKAELLYGDQKTPYNFKEEDAKAVGIILEKKIKEELTDAIERGQNEFNCDYFQFDDTFRISYPVEFKSMDWQNEFSKISNKIEVKVDSGPNWSLDYSNNEVK